MFFARPEEPVCRPGWEGLAGPSLHMADTWGGLPFSADISGYLVLPTCLSLLIPGSWDRVPHGAPREEPASPSAYVSASLCVSLMNE